MGLELRHEREEKEEVRRELNRIKDQYEELRERVAAVDHGQMLELAFKVPLVLLKVEDYRKLREELFALKRRAEAQELERQWGKESEERTRKREAVMDRYEREDIGEEIVRLKRNIDRGIGIGDDSSQHTQAFLTKFRDVEKTLNALSK